MKKNKEKQDQKNRWETHSLYYNYGNVDLSSNNENITTYCQKCGDFTSKTIKGYPKECHCQRAKRAKTNPKKIIEALKELYGAKK